MKRKLWIMLALVAVMAMALWCGTAMAGQGEYAFTAGPVSGVLNVPSQTYTVSWKTNFVPTKIAVLAPTVSNTTFYELYTDTENLSAQGSYPLPAKHGGESFRIRAYYGQEQYVDSSSFIAGPASPAFTVSPSTGALDTAQQTYPVSWKTNFVPTKIAVLAPTISNTAVYELYTDTENLSAQGSYPLPAKHGGERFRIRAYYGQEHYIDSPAFTAGPANPSFTVSPSAGALDTAQQIYPISWKTNFVPTKIAVLAPTISNTAVYELYTDTENLSAQGSYPLPARDGGKRLSIRAYYGNEYYVDSAGFSLPEACGVIFYMHGHGEQVPSCYVYPNTACPQPPDPEEPGWIFEGWYTQNSYHYTFDFSKKLTEVVTVHAKWTDDRCRVTFNMQGHGSQIAQAVLVKGETVPMPADPVADGWVFGGWYTDAGCTAGHKYKFSTPVTENITLYAWWGHTLDFDLNGKGPSSYTISRQKIREGDYAVMPAAYTLRTPDDTYQGWYINGWYQNSACTHKFLFTLPVTASHTLYARWVYDGFTVTYDWNGAHDVTRWKTEDGTSIDQEQDAPVVLKTRTGHSFHEIVPLIYTGSGNPGSVAFTGWYTDPACENPYDFTATATEDITLYAGWARNYTVTRHYTNPYGEMATSFTYTIPYNCVPGDNGFLRYALDNPPHYDGWTAAGYFTDEACTVPFDPDAPLTASVDIYIRWDLASYTVTFDVNGGTGMENVVLTCHYGDVVSRPETLPVKDGFVCKAWYCEEMNATMWASGSYVQWTCTGDAVFLAQWIPDGIQIEDPSGKNFPDAAFRSYVKQFDTNKDGYLSAAEREAVTEISVFSRGIASLQGIGFFPRLQTLICHSNALTSLDVSQNTDLVTLNCGWNQITWLDLNANTKLTTLSASHNALTSVNAVRCTALAGNVYLSNNPDLTTVLLNAPGITSLEIQFTGVTSIDLSGCPNLGRALAEGSVTLVGNEPQFERHYKRIDGIDYYVHVTPGISLDGFIISGIPIDEAHFPDAGFRKYVGLDRFDLNQNGVLTQNEINQITSFINGVSGMRSLQGSEYLPNVTYIVLNRVGLEEIDLSGNTSVNTLVLKKNALTSVDVSMLDSLNHLDVSGNPGLESLTLGSGILETLNCYGCPLIRSLDLSAQPQLLRAYLEGGSPDEYEGDTFMRYAWADEDENHLGFLRVDPDIHIALPEWEWNGTESAVFILPNGSRVNAVIESAVSADGRSVTFTATATVSGVPFTDSKTLCRVSFEGADVPAQVLEPGGYVTWPEDPAMWGHVFGGWFLDAECTDRYYFGEPVTEGFVLWAGWISEADIPGSVEISAENFPDTVFRNYVSNNFDLNRNGWLSEAEIAEVNEVVLENAAGLCSVQGVGYLTAVTGIVIGNAPGFTSLDLSINPAVRDIDIYNTGLDALNVSHLNLSSLGVTCSPLASLTLGNQPDLWLLYADGSALAEADISGCPLLMDAYLYGTRTEENGTVEYSDPETYNTLKLDAGVRVITGLERTVRFETFGSTPEPETLTVMSGETVSEPAAPMMIGTVFTGWYTDEACAEESRFSFDTPVTENLTLYAGWLVPTPAGILELPAMLTEIDAEAFSNVAAEAVIIPPAVTAITGNPFAGSSVQYVYGYAGSAAQALADSCDGFIFVPINDAWLSGR